MIKAEEILPPLRGEGDFIHCVDYNDALKAMREYACQAIDKCAEQTVDKQTRQDILNVKSLLK